MVVRVETFDVVCYDSATVESVERSSCLPKGEPDAYPTY